MTKVKKYFIWYIMSGKRLLKKLSFVILLLMIPMLIPVADSLMAEESGVVKVALSAEDSGKTTNDIIQSLMKKDSIINFQYYENPQDAQTAVEKSNADAAWIFEDNFDEKLKLYVQSAEDVHLVKVIEREDSTAMQLSREVLYSAMFRDISYSLYENFTYSNMVSPHEVTREEMKKTYDNYERCGSVVSLWRLDSGEVKEQQNYLTAPLRGLMSLVVVLCSLAAAMYFLADQKAGKYDWLLPKRRLAPAFALCLNGAVFSAIAVIATLFVSGYSTGIVNEILSALLFVLMTTGFSLVFCTVFSSPAKLGATLPGIMIVSLIMSPIFFTLKVLRPVRLMLPTYYYLMSVHNARYYLYGLIYCVVIYGAVLLLNTVKNGSPRSNGI